MKDRFFSVFWFFDKPCNWQPKNFRICATATSGLVFCSWVQFDFGPFFGQANWTCKHYLGQRENSVYVVNRTMSDSEEQGFGNPCRYTGKGLEGRGQGMECLTPHKPSPVTKGRGIPSLLLVGKSRDVCGHLPHHKNGINKQMLPFLTTTFIVTWCVTTFTNHHQSSAGILRTWQSLAGLGQSLAGFLLN